MSTVSLLLLINMPGMMVTKEVDEGTMYVPSCSVGNSEFQSESPTQLWL